MFLSTRSNYNDPIQRKDLVEFLSHTIEARTYQEGSFAPYKPNENDEFYWTLDAGNNWKVKFFTDKPDTFEIRYRYQGDSNKFEEALAGWLVIRISATILPAS